MKYICNTLVTSKVCSSLWILSIFMTKEKVCHPEAPAVGSRINLYKFFRPILFKVNKIQKVFFQFTLDPTSLRFQLRRARALRPCPAKLPYAKRDLDDTNRKCLLLFSFLFLFVGNTRTVAVRVLIDEQKKPQWTLVSDKGFILKNEQDKPLFADVIYHKLKLTHVKGKLYINGKPFKESKLYVRPTEQPTLFEGRQYDGLFFITKEKDSYLLINILDSEAYVFSVLKTEGWPGWPLEVDKVFAIACRSYLLHQLLLARKKTLPYHIKNSNHHQTYTGVHNCAVKRQAVKETKGMFLAHNGEPILAMFDICCGGVIPHHVNGVVDFQKAPYLARTYPCTFCKKCKSYTWQAEYSLEELRDILQEGVDNFLHDVQDFKITQKDRAGVVQEVTAKTKHSEYLFTTRQAYRLFKDIKSFAFSAKKQSKKIILNGKGFGHHMGLCQWGARSMVKEGWNYESILQFFYPGTTFMRLENSKHS